MTSLAPLLQGFFIERLVNQLQASPHTVAAYRDSFRLLLDFAQRSISKSPSSLDLTDLDADFIGAFLHDLEHCRKNSVRTRNARLAAIRSFFRYAAMKEPAQSQLIQRVLAIPKKRFERAIVNFLTRAEVEALLATPDVATRLGRRDHALLLIAVQTGLRVSELTQLNCQNVHLGKSAHVQCTGKGRKQRNTPLTRQSVRVLRAWLRERDGQSHEPLFPTRSGGRLSRDSVEYLVEKAARLAQQHCPSLKEKHVSPHVLRHTCAMAMLGAGLDRSVIALWLGHESLETTQIYLHADLAIKEKALALVDPPRTTKGRYQAPDSLLAFLEGL